MLNISLEGKKGQSHDLAHGVVVSRENKYGVLGRPGSTGGAPAKVQTITRFYV